MGKNKICVVGVYFGKFPNYFPLWMKSSGKNTTVDFLIFTDQKQQSQYPNIRFVNMDIAEFGILASEKLKLQTNIKRPYKCCDFRPAYGIIFSEYLQDYDYWGHCDFDMIFGDLQYFFDKYQLYKYDRFLPLGHLSLYRNTEKVNEVYKLDGAATDYIHAFSSEENCYFDELCGTSAIFLKHRLPLFCGRIFADISPIYKRFKFSEYYRLDKKVVNYRYQTFSWENGKIWHAYIDKKEIKKQEYIYIHFQKRPNYAINESILSLNAYYVTNRGFTEWTEETAENIKRQNKYNGKLYEWSEQLRFIVKRKYRGLCRRIAQLKRKRITK